MCLLSNRQSTPAPPCARFFQRCSSGACGISQSRHALLHFPGPKTLCPSKLVAHWGLLTFEGVRAGRWILSLTFFAAARCSESEIGVSLTSPGICFSSETCWPSCESAFPCSWSGTATLNGTWNGIETETEISTLIAWSSNAWGASVILSESENESETSRPTANETVTVNVTFFPGPHPPPRRMNRELQLPNPHWWRHPSPAAWPGPGRSYPQPEGALRRVALGVGLLHPSDPGPCMASRASLAASEQRRAGHSRALEDRPAGAWLRRGLVVAAEVASEAVPPVGRGHPLLEVDHSWEVVQSWWEAVQS